MRSRGVVEDQVEATVDDGADRPAFAPQFVAVEMLVIELKAVGAEEWTRLQAKGPVVDRPTADAKQALDHRRHLRRRHVRTEDRHLLCCRPPLADERLTVPQPC